MKRWMKRVTAAAALAAMECLIAPLGGCATYANYPARGEKDPAINDPNIFPAPEVIRVALERVLSRWPVEGEFVVNLPQGMTRRRAEEILRKLHDPNARLVSAEAAGLPAFHVTRVWIRPGARAQVEVLRPVFGIGGRDEAALFQPVTVKMRQSPLTAWRVDAVRVWPIGQAETPELFGWPEEAPPQPAAAPAPSPESAATFTPTPAPAPTPQG